MSILARRFIQRWDMYPRQLDDGRYITVHEPLNVGLLYAHLRGELTLGTYLLNPESEARFVVLDADSSQSWGRLKFASQELFQAGVIAYRERSRRGGHLWFYLDEPTNGEDARRFAEGLLELYGVEDVEIFPKQETLTSGPGSLIRLPFGFHRRTGRRYGFYLPNGEPLAPSLRDQLRVLDTPATVPKPAFEEFRNAGSAEREKADYGASGCSMGKLDASADVIPLSEQIKAAVTVRDFVSQFVELSPSGKGLCPFHDDHRPSFSVNDEENYWYCFACGTGGSIIDFWMKWRDCSFRSALSEMRELLNR